MTQFRWGAFFAVCSAAALLAACSNKPASEVPKQEGRAAEAPSSAPVSSKPADNRRLIVAFGDSLTSGVVENTYPQYLQDLIDKNRLPFRVENQGVAGDTSSDGLARVANVTAEKPAVVLLEFGGNDGLRGLPVEATKQNLEDMIKQLRQPGTQLFLLGITLPPNYGPDYVKPFTAMFPELSRQYHIPLLPFLLLNIYQHSDLMQPDGIHPNGEGNKIVAQDVFRLIQPYLERMRKQ